MLKNIYHVQWTGRQAVIALPEYVDVSNAAQAPRGRPMGAEARLVALRKDGTTFPAEISLSPVATVTGTLTLTVIRDVTKARRLTDLADLARAAVAAQQAHRGQELLDSITTSLCNVGLSLQDAADLPYGEVGKDIAEALGHLDDTIREIRDAAFTTPDQLPPRPSLPEGAGPPSL